ncbi:hypothetical protein, conserved [Plasmodium gonderi]|uniref:AAR2 protein n=1 Tax=Plasmodium gonderi TaxID=77519 RepID=A0A1Y1JR04_PLAGO|nr:hypothetical protein, conserved [Plasmodium gonderi]GAW83262.1 hypothetical protein, conserved [Plasmodium gonderi]
MILAKGRNIDEDENLNSVLLTSDRCSLVLLMDNKRDKKEKSDKENQAYMKYKAKKGDGYKNENTFQNDKKIEDNEISKKKEHMVITGMIKILQEMKEKDDNSKPTEPGTNKDNNEQDMECNTTLMQNRNEVRREKDQHRDHIKLHVGLDYSNFDFDTPYKIIKFMNKGSHFLYWGSDTLFSENNNVSKEFKMNEMKKNNCEELRNSRFIYFDREKTLLVLKYNIKNNNFTYVNENDSVYMYFCQLHDNDFLDDNIIKENKNSILIYPYTYVKIWKSLTSYINEEVINKIEPVNKTFCSSFLKEEEEGEGGERGEKKKKGKISLNKDEEMNLCNQPYMFYSVIPKYPPLSNYHKEEEGKEVSRRNIHKKEDNIKDEREFCSSGSVNCYEMCEEDMHDDVSNNDASSSDESKNEKFNNDEVLSESSMNAKKSYFERINVDNKHKKYVPSDLTIIHLEKYWILKEIIQQEYTYLYYENEKREGFHKFENKLFYILGEFQFAYILFHLGFNYQSFVQWRNLFELLSNSQHLVTNFADFFEEVLRVIHTHLSHLSDDFFDNTENSFILFGIYNIYEIISNVAGVKGDIVKVMNSIDSIIYTKLGLHLPDLSFVYSEYQPTYVDDD